MRPSILNPLFSGLSSLPGIGAKLQGTLGRLLRGHGEARVADLLFHLPTGLVDRRNRPGVARAPQGAVVTLKLRIDRHQPPEPGPRGGRGRQPWRVFGHDESGEIALTFFRPRAEWIERSLPVGGTRWVSGRVDWFGGRAAMVHPDFILAEDELDRLPAVEPVYPLTEGISQKVLAKAIGEALATLPALPEWTEPSVLRREAWPTFAEALRQAHHPQSEADLEPASLARARLAHDEMLAGQLALGLMRARLRRARGQARQPTGALSARMEAAFRWPLTGSQRTALAEIVADLCAPERMLRLLQGDVGSGKTIVAALAAAAVIEDGAQAAVMAPTELLARQHHAVIAPLAQAAGIDCVLFTGRDKGREREAILSGLRAGTIPLVVGTHALFQEAVEFAELGLAVVDEQHRFGVEQRLALGDKAPRSDILVMTATPIPRTLVLSHYGDMDVSRLTERPAGRKPIATTAIPVERLGELVERIALAVERGEKAFWICPLVEESEAVDLVSAQERHAALAERFGARVGLVHGRMPGADKDAAMARFASGQTRLLVATTVVEVGVDVPDASIIVIEHAERFGLAQLHQLRGRVGRGDQPAACILLYRGPLGEAGRARLNTLRETADGFAIAEADLALRGEGEILGTRQSGTPGFRLADPAAHGAILELARDEARLALVTDPSLTGPRGEALRSLLYLFGQHEAIRLIRSG